jgi:hypothetical protein
MYDNGIWFESTMDPMSAEDPSQCTNRKRSDPLRGHDIPNRLVPTAIKRKAITFILIICIA